MAVTVTVKRRRLLLMSTDGRVERENTAACAKKRGERKGWVEGERDGGSPLRW